MASEEVFVPAGPARISHVSHVFATELLGVKVVTKLYGPMSPKRLETETLAHKHRLEQLQPVEKMTAAEEYQRFKDEERAEKESRRSGNRDRDLTEDDFED